MRYALILCALLAGCSGGSSGGNGGNPEPPLPPPPPPPPPANCDLTVIWENPTEDVDDVPLDADELVAAYVWFFKIPEEPRDIEMQHWADAYTLRFTYVGVPESTGQVYYISMTVANLDADGNEQQSDHSNQIEKICEEIGT